MALGHSRPEKKPLGVSNIWNLFGLFELKTRGLICIKIISFPYKNFLFNPNFCFWSKLFLKNENI